MLAPLPDTPARDVGKVPPVPENCKLMHIEDDLSLVSCLYLCLFLIP